MFGAFDRLIRNIFLALALVSVGSAAGAGSVRLLQPYGGQALGTVYTGADSATLLAGGIADTQLELATDYQQWKISNSLVTSVIGGEVIRCQVPLGTIPQTYVTKECTVGQMAARGAAASALKRLRFGDLTATIAPAARPTVTLSAANTLTFASGYSDVDKFDTRLTYQPPIVAQQGGTFPSYQWLRGKTLQLDTSSGTRGSNGIRQRFISDAPKLELLYGGQNGAVRLWVDGQPYAPAATAGFPNDSAQYGLQIDWGADVQTIVPSTTFSFSAAGSGYAVGDQFSPVGGTGTAAVMVVTRVSAGAITGASFLSFGAYTALPGAASATTTTGSGTGATITLSAGTNSGHTTRKMRRYEIWNSDAAAGNVHIGLYDTIRPWSVSGPRMLVVGDSYPEGSFQDYPGGTFGYRIAQRLGIEDYWNSGIGSTGFLATASQSYGAQYIKPTYRQRFMSDVAAYAPTDPATPFIVFTQGSINDQAQNTAALQAEVTAYYIQAFTTLPSAYFVQTGILKPPGNAVADSQSAAIKAGFLAAQAIYDPLGRRSGYIETRATPNLMTPGGAGGAKAGDAGPATGNTFYYIGTDAAHATQEGHNWLGDAWALDLLTLISTWTQ